MLKRRKKKLEREVTRFGYSESGGKRSHGGVRCE